MPNGPKLGPKLGFCYFLKFGSSVLLEIAYNDILQECLTSSSGEIHEENFLGPSLDRRCKISSEIRFFAIFSGFVD